jgi:hypothetical protein
MIRSVLCWFVPFVLVLLTGCGSEVANNPDGEIQCQGNEDCSPGYICRDNQCIVQPNCTDLDRDGYCDVREGCAECVDCNDNRSDIYPGAEEACDGADNDCDGDVDEGCPCNSGEVKPCGTDVGICKKGTATCENGQWGECDGGVQPEAEACDDDVDNDCNGSINDGCPCLQGDTRACGSSLGECTQGVQECLESGGEWLWGECTGGTPPQDEVCEDGLDNDCDGSLDNGCECEDGTRPCGLNVGICHAGIQHCRYGEWLTCEGARMPEDETCDGLDNDCDHLTDEGCECLDGEFESCGDDTGECRVGTRTCQNGHWGPCVGAQGPVAELCDSKDNDCDTDIDEDFPDLLQGCAVGLGICARPGVMICSADKTHTECSQTQPGTGFDELCDGLDNDCDGETDENFPGVGEPCSRGDPATLCYSEGVMVCGQGGGDPVCNAVEIPPEEELCDGIDNNCNGEDDENFPHVGLPCYAGVGECFTQGHYACLPDGSDAVCDAVPPSGSAEDCNGLDDDCDGRTDEDWVESCVGPCGDTGYRICVGGTPSQCYARQPTTEICDYFDNNCDGSTDEGFSNLGNTCQNGQGACLSLGYYVCNASGSGTICNAVAGRPQNEGPEDTCIDGIDNDCDTDTDGSDDDCSCKNVSMKDLLPLQIVGGGLGMVIIRRRKKKKSANEEQGGGS